MKSSYHSKSLLASLLCLALIICTAFSGCAPSARDKSGANSDDNSSSPYKAYNDTQKFLQNIKVGWNLGNTFEATGRWGEEWNDSYSVNDVETGWGNPTTTKSMFDKVKKTGFNAVRIPATWYRHTDVENATYTIKKDYLERIKQVVDFAIDNDMYVILNMHHDDKDWLDISANDEKWAAIKNEYAQIWTQIAEQFKNYDERLILEGANEIVLYTGVDENGNKQYDWWGQDDQTFERVNELYQVFVDTVRKSGGKNDKRYLMIPTYGAQWYQHQIEKITIPNGDERVIVDIHWYTDEADETKVRDTLKVIYDYCSYFEMPIVLGECGIRKAMTEEQKQNWANNYIKIASNMGLRCFIWDDGGDYQVLDRNTLSWVSDSFVESVVKNAVDVGSVPEPTSEAFDEIDSEE